MAQSTCMFPGVAHQTHVITAGLVAQVVERAAQGAAPMAQEEPQVLKALEEVDKASPHTNFRTAPLPYTVAAAAVVLLATAGIQILDGVARAVVLVAATTMAARAGLRLQTREVAAAVAVPEVIAVPEALAATEALEF